MIMLVSLRLLIASGLKRCICLHSPHPSSPAENNIHVHDLLTFQQITVVAKAKGATLFTCDLQVSQLHLLDTMPLVLSHVRSDSHPAFTSTNM